MLLKDKVALVTGAGSGIGRAIAAAFAHEGAQVVLSDLDEAGLAGTLARLREAGADAIAVAGDVSREEDARRLVQEAVKRYGRLDVACNNAGIGGDLAPTAEYPVESWRRVVDVNLVGVFLGMKFQIAQMLRNGGGAVVNIASILGSVGMANAGAYTAAKHGVVGLTQAAALEYAEHGIRVTAVGPAFIHTPMISRLEGDDGARAALEALHPMGRLGLPQEVAELVVWLSSAKASFVTGSYHAVDGGYLAR